MIRRKNMMEENTVIITDNELMLLCFDEAKLVRGEPILRQFLDNQFHRFNSKNLILTNVSSRWSSIFPFIPFQTKQFNADLNTRLCENYFGILDQMFDQRDILKYITDHANTDTIVLILVDGLSYYDTMSIPKISPCMVPGPTTTENGFKNIVQEGVIFSLYDRGYKKRYGFSFWDRGNEITNTTFRGFPTRSMYKIREFQDSLNILEDKDLKNTFVQILIHGYDQDSHGKHDRPLVDSIVNRIFKEYVPKLVCLLKRKVATSRVFLTADHGIWWASQLEQNPSLKILNYPKLETGNQKYHRSYKGYHEGEEFIQWETEQGTTSMLKYPYLASGLKSNEWGKHGGVSIFESFVPFLELEVV